MTTAADIHRGVKGALFSVGAGAMLLVGALALLITLGWALFVGMHVLFSVILFMIAAFSAYRRNWWATGIVTAIALFILLADPFELTLLDVGLSMGVDPLGT